MDDLEQQRREHGPVTVICMPHNYRAALYAEGEAPSTFGDDPDDDSVTSHASPMGSDFAVLPIPMPTLLFMRTDRTGKPIAAWADDQRIRWRDIDVVVTGVRQYNEDCDRAGITSTPRLQPPEADEPTDTSSNHF
jgi:hypothetical protein